MPEFIANLPVGDIVWGGLKVVAVDDRGNLVSRRPKYISIKVRRAIVAKRICYYFDFEHMLLERYL